LVHLLHCILDTLEAKSELHWNGHKKLKESIYSPYWQLGCSDGLSLQAGTFSRPPKKYYTSTKVDTLRNSKRWKPQVDPFLRKHILRPDTIQINLQRWIVEFESATDSSGHSLFTHNTKKVAIEQIKKVKHVSYPVDVPMYAKTSSGPRLLHNLPKWKSNRPELLLENFHELLTYLANTGTNPALTDAITLRGTAEHNVRSCWKVFLNNNKLQGQKLDIRSITGYHLGYITGIRV